jgi:hypothetical protein
LDAPFIEVRTAHSTQLHTENHTAREEEPTRLTAQHVAHHLDWRAGRAKLKLPFRWRSGCQEQGRRRERRGERASERLVERKVRTLANFPVRRSA